MSNVAHAKGALLQRSVTGAAGTYTSIAELTDHNIDFNIDDIDVTNHQSVSRYRERIASLISVGIQCEANLLPADTTQNNSGGGLLADALTGATRHYRMISAGGTTMFTGMPCIVTNVSEGFPVEGKETYSFTLINNGAPVSVN